MEQKQIIDGTVLIILLGVLIVIAYHYRKPGNCSIDPVLEKLKEMRLKLILEQRDCNFFLQMRVTRKINKKSLFV